MPTDRRASWARSVWAVLRRPSLWPTAIVVVRRLARPGWWRRPPFLPLPDHDYWAFRSVTAFGSAEAPPDPRDVVAYLEWCRAWPDVTRG
jgi:hypothetical protein